MKIKAMRAAAYCLARMKSNSEWLLKQSLCVSLNLKAMAVCKPHSSMCHTLALSVMGLFDLDPHCLQVHAAPALGPSNSFQILVNRFQ